MNDAFRFPAVRHLCGGYLNRDWPREYGTVEAALETYARDSEPARLVAVVTEIGELLDAGPSVVLATLTALGCAYVFPDPAAAVTFIQSMRRTLEGRVEGKRLS